MLLEKIKNLQNEADELVASTLEELESFRLKYLSKNGILNDLLKEFRDVPHEEKKELGKSLNELKTRLTDKYKSLKLELESKGASTAEFDLTATPLPLIAGSRHPISIVKDKLVDIFAHLGFSLADGPEIEDDWHVFSSMNFAEDHPARDMQDTFFIESHPDILLRTHTSSVQSRVMETSKPPIRVICPGRVFRNEDISARAHCFFHQLEGLYVDKNVGFSDLLGIMQSFSKQLFGKDTKIRLRPSYFPFTEPSAEMDISCHICHGSGHSDGGGDCVLCKGSGWVEILGCGMVDPEVLRLNGIDSSVYSGYAFGMGLERIANLLYRVSDLRLFSENEKQFLEQFSPAE